MFWFNEYLRSLHGVSFISLKAETSGSEAAMDLPGGRYMAWRKKWEDHLHLHKQTFSQDFLYPFVPLETHFFFPTEAFSAHFLYSIKLGR